MQWPRGIAENRNARLKRLHNAGRLCVPRVKTLEQGPESEAARKAQNAGRL